MGRKESRLDGTEGEQAVRAWNADFELVVSSGRLKRQSKSGMKELQRVRQITRPTTIKPFKLWHRITSSTKHRKASGSATTTQASDQA
jgi:hypothetical protein